MGADSVSESNFGGLAACWATFLLGTGTIFDLEGSKSSTDHGLEWWTSEFSEKSLSTISTIPQYHGLFITLSSSQLNNGGCSMQVKGS